MNKQSSLQRFKALPKITRYIILVSVLAVLVAGCTSPTKVPEKVQEKESATSVPTLTTAPTNTLEPTATSTTPPTATLSPTSTTTSTPTVTPTSVPTATETITPTAVQVRLNPCLPENTKVENGKVFYITDGDTIHVNINGLDYPVRYIGIDTPEKGEPYSQEATNRNEELVAGKDVVLVKDTSETDRYGRLLRYVFVDGVFVNDTLVKEGFARAKAYPPDTSCNSLFTSTEDLAKEQNLGLWVLATGGTDTGSQVVVTPVSGSSCPQGCTEQIPGCEIKGNINSEGVKIYHDHSSPSYEKTKIDPSKGERWFCTAEEAVANGWRAPRN